MNPKPVTAETEVIPPNLRADLRAFAIVLNRREAEERTARFVAVLGALYRLIVAAGAGVLVWRGCSAWVMLATVPLVVFAPKIRR